MKKLLLSLFFFVSFLFVFASSANASTLVTVNSEGDTVWNVLGESNFLALGIADRGKISVTDSATQDTSSLALKKEGDKLFLNDLDVTNWNSDLVEVEERGNVKKITIGRDKDSFTISQNGVVALANFPINVRPKENELSVTTSSGSVFLSVLPYDAAESALRSRFISRLPEKKIFLTEDESGNLAYKVPGEKVFNILNVIDYPITVTANVSVSTGEILSIEGPEWFKVFGFLFS